MASDKPEIPRTQTSAPARPAGTTKDVPAREPERERAPSRHASDDPDVGGDRIPKGADEPGAGL